MGNPDHPPLPSDPREVWQGGFLTPSQPVSAVSAGAGLIVGGGSSLFMVRPAGEQILSRPLPPAIGPIVAVAAEPWAPHRFAIAARGRISIFEGERPEEPVLEASMSNSAVDATHLAWVREKGEVALYFRTRGKNLGRIWVDRPAQEFLEAPPLNAVASDASGRLAMICDGSNYMEVMLAKADGSGFDVREPTMIFDDDADPDVHVYLAVHGDSVAYSVKEWGSGVSWSPDQRDFEPTTSLYGGPIAFQDAETLFGAYCVDTNGSIFRETRDGRITRVADIEAEGGDDAQVNILSLAWDPSRRVLWGASPECGLLQSREPLRPGERKIVLS